MIVIMFKNMFINSIIITPICTNRSWRSG